MNHEIVDCHFLPIKQSSYTDNLDTKDGLYSASSYAIEGYGSSKWAVLAYLKVDYQKYFDEGWSLKRLIDQCLTQINTPTETKKQTKKGPKFKYGTLTPIVSKITGEYTAKCLDGKIILEMTTDDRSNNNFWGVGERTL